jgi:hypothetical protein
VSLPTIASPSGTTLWRRLTRGVRTLRQTPDWSDYAGADWADRIMQVEVTDRFFAKQGRSIARWKLTTRRGESLSVYLKRHYRLSRLKGWMATLFPWRAWSPGMQEWHHLEWAREAGLPVPRAVCAGELIGPGGKLQSFLAVEELVGMLPLHEAIPLAKKHLDPLAFRVWKRGLIGEMARLSGELHSRRRFHKDLYLCHFYIPETLTQAIPTDWEGRVFMIDFHRLGRHVLTGAWYRVKDLAQLLYSSDVEGVTARDRSQFWRDYSARLGFGRRFLSWAILRKYRLYRRHNERK